MKHKVAVPLAVFSVLASATVALFIKGYLAWAYVCLGGSLVMLSITLFNWLTSQPSPLDLKIVPCDDLRHNDYMGPGGRDIFGRVRIELLEPAKVRVKGYSATFSRKGVTENIQVLNDADKWLLVDPESSTPRHDPVGPLPNELRSGHPVEGWFHFKTTKDQYQLESGRLDFSVDTALGGRSVEIPLTHEQWNGGHQNVIMPRL
jgi:hypothetical protein